MYPNGTLACPVRGPIVRAMRKMRVVVAENSALMREGLRWRINTEPDMECVAVAKNGRQCLDLCRELLPDVAVVDDALQGADGLALANILGKRTPQVRVVMYAWSADVCEVARDAGAAGCVAKTSSYDDLLGTLRRAAHAESLTTH
jgi:two-component system invasion response regulator UvrY